MTAHHITVDKTARYYVLGEVGATTSEVWVCCHGYGQLAGRFARSFEAIVRPGRVIIVPEALHRFYLDAIDQPASERRVGATWMTREDREHDIADYVRYLELLSSRVGAGVAPDALWVGFGFSQGTATITRWAVESAFALTRLILWGSGLPPDLDWETAHVRLRQMRVVLVGGSTDVQMPRQRWAEQERLLVAHNITFERIEFEGGHHLDDAVLQQLTKG